MQTSGERAPPQRYGKLPEELGPDRLVPLSLKGYMRLILATNRMATATARVNIHCSSLSEIKMKQT